MDTQQTLELYKSTKKFLDDLNEALLTKVYSAIHKAENELNTHFYGLRDWLRAPFGSKITGIDAIETIKTLANSDKETVTFYEHVFMRPANKHTYMTSDIKIIAKYLDED